MRACWTLSCQHRLTKIALTLLAHRGPSGDGSSSLVCLRVPWYTWGLIGCVKFSLRVWVYLSCWYCECYTVWRGCLFISGLWRRVCAHVKSLGSRFEKGPDGSLLVFGALSWSVGSLLLSMAPLYITTQDCDPPEESRTPPPCPYLAFVILHRTRIDRTYKWHLRWKEVCAITSRKQSVLHLFKLDSYYLIGYQDLHRPGINKAYVMVEVMYEI